MFTRIHLYTVLLHKICPIYRDQICPIYRDQICQPSMLSGKYILCHHLLYQMFIIPANNMVNDEIHDCGKNRRQFSNRSYKCITLLDLHRHLQNKTQLNSLKFQTHSDRLKSHFRGSTCRSRMAISHYEGRGEGKKDVCPAQNEKWILKKK